MPRKKKAGKPPKKKAVEVRQDNKTKRAELKYGYKKASVEAGIDPNAAAWKGISELADSAASIAGDFSGGKKLSSRGGDGLRGPASGGNPPQSGGCAATFIGLIAVGSFLIYEVITWV